MKVLGIGLFILSLTVLPQLLPAQDPVLEVVTKTIEESYKYQPGFEVAVEGEKAEIFVETWDEPSISVRIEMTARHAQLETAREEIENLSFSIEQVKNKIYLQNGRKNPDLKPASRITVHYYITLPEECPVYVKNHFGAANISNLRNRLRIFGEYSQININNVTGLMDIRTRFGDIFGEKLDGNVTINARRSDITLEDFGGNFTINAQYGQLKLRPNASLAGLQVTADQSDVVLLDGIGDLFSYTLTSTHGDIAVPTELRVSILESTDEVQRIRIQPPTENRAEINISVTFGDLTIEQQREQLRRVRY